MLFGRGGGFNRIALDEGFLRCWRAKPQATLGRALEVGRGLVHLFLKAQHAGVHAVADVDGNEPTHDAPSGESNFFYFDISHIILYFII